MDFRSFLCCTSASNRKDKVKKESTWRIFSLKELHAATNNFNRDNMLGAGGFGSVYYWGQLPDGSQIAVKQLVVWSKKLDMEFTDELEILARVRHKNLLSSCGYCAEGEELLIVYDYMPNLSLLSHLHGHNASETILDWPRRMTIAIGAAEGIAYLHHHATPHIIHRSIKASNVLLDSDFKPQVTDFGYAKLIPVGKTDRTAGWYIAPEYAMLGKVSVSCDVYSFGILLLELVSGKKPNEKINSTVISITEWALRLVSEQKFSEIADPKMNGKYVEEELKRVVIIGIICARYQPNERPSMVQVVKMLKGELKFAAIENNEMFVTGRAVDCHDEVSVADYSSGYVSEEKERVQEIDKAT